MEKRAIRGLASALSAALVGSIAAIIPAVLAAPPAAAAGPCGPDGQFYEINATTKQCYFAFDWDTGGRPFQFTVPDHLTSIDVQVTGAYGGPDYDSSSDGGPGGTVSATIAVTPFEVLQVVVGGDGEVGSSTNGIVAPGGYNGGGNGGANRDNQASGGGGGGGASEIRRAPYGLADRLAVGGGGGGGGGYSASRHGNAGLGGEGGSPDGGAGRPTNYTPQNNAAGGAGATTTAPGEGCGGACSGSGAQGGTGATANPGFGSGGGGGGGWFGGAGGPAGTLSTPGGGGGGGGSSYGPPGSTYASYGGSSVAITFTSSAPVFTTASATTFAVGSAGSFTVQARSGGISQPVALTNGVLPSGVAYNATTRVLSGTPLSNTGGVYPLEFTATDTSTGQTTRQNFTLTVFAADPAITSAASTTFPSGRAGTFTVTTTGTPTPTVSLTSGTLPAGVTFDPATSVLSGTTTATGTYPLAFTASNGETPDAVQNFTLSVVATAPAFTSAPSGDFIVGVFRSSTVTASGNPPPVYSVASGTMPAGLSLNPTTGVLSGTVAAGTAPGTYPVTLNASNGIPPDATQAFTIQVTARPSGPVPQGTGRCAYSSLTPTTFAVPAGVTSLSVDAFGGGGGSNGSKAGGKGGRVIATIPVTAGEVLQVNIGGKGANGTSSGANAAGGANGGGAGGSIPDGYNGSGGGGGATDVRRAPNGLANRLVVAGGGGGTGGSGFGGGGTGDGGVGGGLTGGTGGTGSNGGGGAGGSGGTQAAGGNGCGGSCSGSNNVGGTGPAGNSTTGAPGGGGGGGFFGGGGGGRGLDFDGGSGAFGGGGGGGGSSFGPAGTTFATATSTGNGTIFITYALPAQGVAPAFTSAASATLTAGTAGTFTVTASGNPAPTFSSSTLPSGLTLSSGGVLSGTPATGTGGVYPVTITASNNVGTAQQSFTLTVNEAPAFTSASSTTFTAGSLGSFSVTASGYPAATFALTGGSLPSGVSLSSSGVLSGTPASGTGGTYPLSFSATNSAGTTMQSFTLTVNEAPVFTSQNAAALVAGQNGAFSVHAEGFPTGMTYALTGGLLPSGVTFSAGGLLSGTPAAGTGGSYPLTLRATNAAGSATQSFTLFINEAPAFTSEDHTTFTVGSAGSFAVTASGFPAAASIALAGGSLPAGVTYDGTTGQLAGTPAAGTGGTYPLSFSATNSAGTTMQSFTLTVNEAPVFTSQNAAALVAGQNGAFSVHAEGFPTGMTYALTGGLLPSGVTFSAGGLLSGTPAAGTGGSYPLTLRATNAAGSATQSFTLFINEAPAFTSEDHTTFTVGSAGSFAVTASGFPAAASIALAGGSLPAGVTYDGTTGQLSGTPASGTGGTYPLSFSATNSAGTTMQSFTLTVNEAPVFTSQNAAALVAGQNGAFSVHAEGFPTGMTYALTGGLLPSGVTFSAGGLLSGTPAAGTGGSYPLTLRATNAAGSATQSFTLFINEAPAFTSEDHTTFTVGSAGSFAVTASGFPAAASIALAGGSLPAGVTYDGTTGQLSGTPASGTGGTYPLSFSATNSAGTTMQSFTLTVNEAPVFTSQNAAALVAGQNGAFSVHAEGFPTGMTYALTGGLLPSGVTFSAGGLLSGTPAAGTGGSYPLTLRATNAAGSATQSFTLFINEAPAFTSASSATFTVGSLGSFSVTASGYPAATFALAGGSLPSGVSLNNSGVLSGTPASGTGGTYPLSFSATNSAGTTMQSFTLTVKQAPAFTSANHATFSVGSVGSFTVTATGNPAPTFSSTTLPSGLTLSAGGLLSGTPAAGTGGAYAITVTATNSVGSTTQSFTLTVNQLPAITSANAATFTTGAAGSFTVTATGFPAPALALAGGTLPTGVTFSSATGQLSGTPAPGTGGTYPLSFSATNVAGTVTQSFTLTVKAPPVFTSASRVSFRGGVTSSFTVKASGLPTPTLAKTGGTLPSWATFNPATGVLSGKPPSGSNATYPLTFTATNSAGTATQSFTLVVDSTAPSCQVVATRITRTSREQDMRLTDTGGFGSITNVHISYGQLFFNGQRIDNVATTSLNGSFAATVTAKNTTYSRATVYSFDLYDAAGNKRTCQSGV